LSGLLLQEAHIAHVVCAHVLTWYFCGKADKALKELLVAVLEVGECLLKLFDVSVFPLAEGALGFAVLLSAALGGY
jgi:hypothetical protein